MISVADICRVVLTFPRLHELKRREITSRKRQVAGQITSSSNEVTLSSNCYCGGEMHQHASKFGILNYCGPVGSVDQNRP